jgi:hypothetical protein
MKIFFYTIVLSFLFSSNVFADQCVLNKYGDVICADTPGGSCAVNKYGNVEFGAGGCAVNQYGNVECSNTPGGGYAVNKYGNVECN